MDYKSPSKKSKKNKSPSKKNKSCDSSKARRVQGFLASVQCDTKETARTLAQVLAIWPAEDAIREAFIMENPQFYGPLKNSAIFNTMDRQNVVLKQESKASSKELKDLCFKKVSCWDDADDKMISDNYHFRMRESKNN